MTVTKSIDENAGAASPPDDVPPLRRVASYDVFAPIARGGGGSVWLAFDRKSPALRRVVAVKFVHRDGSDDDDANRRFLREARIGSAIRHTNVVEVLEVGEEGGQPYIVMPYIEGVDVRTLGQRGVLPIDVALTIVADALRGLDAAHEARTLDGRPSGVVHRDLSPHNLLVGVDGTTKLTDFGIARPLEGPDRSITGWAEGKVAYFSPEQARGEPLDRRSDVFAAGIVLWELLVSRQLFRDKDPFVTAHRVQTMRVPPPSSERPEVAPALDGVTSKALAKAPGERYATAAAMLTALLDAATQAGIVLRPEVVADYVRTHASAQLAERAEVLRRAVEAAPSASDAPRVAGARGTDEEDLTVVAPPRSRRPHTVVVLLGLVVLVGAVAVLVLGRRAGPVAEVERDDASSASTVAPSPGWAGVVVPAASSAPPLAGSASPALSSTAQAPPAMLPSSRPPTAAPRDRRTRPPGSTSAPKLPINRNPF